MLAGSRNRYDFLPLMINGEPRQSENVFGNIKSYSKSGDGYFNCNLVGFRRNGNISGWFSASE